MGENRPGVMSAGIRARAAQGETARMTLLSSSSTMSPSSNFKTLARPAETSNPFRPWERRTSSLPSLAAAFSKGWAKTCDSPRRATIGVENLPPLASVSRITGKSSRAAASSGSVFSTPTAKGSQKRRHSEPPSLKSLSTLAFPANSSFRPFR